jgi:four helix bundle protein
MRGTERRNGGIRQPAKRLVRKHTDLEVFRRAFEVAMRLFALSKSFPREERYSLTDQIRRSSRSVSTNIAEAWRKRRYEAAFAAKLNDAEAEAAETQTWIQFCVECEYVKRDVAVEIYREYDEILSMLVSMICNAGVWKI